MREIDRVPEYVHDRIERANNLGHKYMVGVGLCVVLIATIQGGYGNSEWFAGSLSASRRAASETSLQQTTATMCKRHPLNHEIDA
ncbi:hypothetical protein [Phyllobacterium chamaecytisi]|uniref:hypothetical protein n=1 Tax=Phyllobacterium chamaecytisi TaxID=2876082 RepID=UPI001CCFD61F|nr:hypothetical protein [Phyllobacterium sp. KW56]MBZ9601109.1 hypothetical protein [Phyllobacterium sp. KW56]